MRKRDEILNKKYYGFKIAFYNVGFYGFLLLLVAIIFISLLKPERASNMGAFILPIVIFCLLFENRKSMLREHFILRQKLREIQDCLSSISDAAVHRSSGGAPRHPDVEDKPTPEGTKKPEE